MKATVDPARRRFFRAAGAAALAAPLAAAAAPVLPPGGANGTDGAGDARDAALRAKLARLEDESALRDLRRAYVRHLRSGDAAALAALFAAGVGARPDPCVRTLELDADDGAVELAADGRSAVTGGACTVAVEAPIGPDCTLLQMARAQGGGTLLRSERAALRLDAVKVEGVWKIAHVALAKTGLDSGV